MRATEDVRVVRICLPEVILEGNLAVKEGQPVVIFAHDSGSSHHSPRNRFVAHALHEAGIGTLLFDLLTREGGLKLSDFSSELSIVSSSLAPSIWYMNGSLAPVSHC